MKVNKVFVFSIILWAFITIIRMLNHIPWFDEAHAWTIAQELTIPQIFQLMKVEGHMMIWYLLIMPFAKLDLFYPYSMQFINWTFCLLALIVLWKKAPFPNFLKVLITFSFPFLAVYSIYARCYSIGIFLLFLLTTLYKEKLDHPILYSIILVLCANTSVMALFGTTAFGILFLYDFFKQKMDLKKLIIPMILFLICGALILFSLTKSDSTYLNLDIGITLDYFRNVFFIGYPIINILLLTIFGILTIIFIKNSPQALFILTFTYACLIYTSVFKWTGHFWNHYFYYIYFILAIWLALLKSSNTRTKFIGIISLTLISLCFTFNYAFANDSFIKLIFYDKEIPIIRSVLNDKTLQNKTLIIDNNGSIGYMLLPYAKKNHYKLKNYCQDKEFNYSAKNHPAENDICFNEDIPNKKYEKIYTTIISANRLDEIYTEPSYFVGAGLTEKLSANGNKFKLKNYELTKYNCYLKNCIWKIEKLN